MRDIDLSTPRTVLGTYRPVDAGQAFSNGAINHNSPLRCPELVLSSQHVTSGLPLLSTPPNPTIVDQSNPTIWFQPNDAPVVLWDVEGSGLGSLLLATQTTAGPFPDGAVDRFDRHPHSARWLVD